MCCISSERITTERYPEHANFVQNILDMRMSAIFLIYNIKDSYSNHLQMAEGLPKLLAVISCTAV